MKELLTYFAISAALVAAAYLSYSSSYHMALVAFAMGVLSFWKAVDVARDRILSR